MTKCPPRRRLGTDRRGNTTQDGDGGDPVGHLVCTRERVGPTAAQTDDGESLDTQRLRELLDVVRELDGRRVGVRRRCADARPLHGDQADVSSPTRLARLPCDLSTRTGRTVEPQNLARGRRPDLGAAQLTAGP